MLVECDHCQATVDGKVIGQYKEDYDELGVTERVSLLRCPRCGSPLLMAEIENDPFDTPKRLYPPIAMGLSFAIPAPLRSAFEEANSCFRAKAYTATAIMCRKTLEGIADANSISTRNLAGALREMKDKGIIENRLYAWADELRIAGNEAAHGVDTKISPQDAKDILEFTHALLEYVFTFQEKFEQYKKRKNPPTAPPEDSTPPPEGDIPF